MTSTAAANLPEIDEIVENFEFLEDWEDRFGYLIDLGKKLPSLPDADINDANKVHGCQASVWLVMDVRGDAGQNRVWIQAVSDAHIVNGLIAILLSLYNSKSPRQVLDADAEMLFTNLGLEEHLSPTRRNGLHAMIGRVRDLARSIP